MTIVGIDLGTTNSAVAVLRPGGVEVIPNALGSPLTPSVVAMDPKSSALMVGSTARSVHALHPDLGATLFKRSMGSENKFSIAGARHGAVELSSLVLESLRRDAAAALGEEVNRCVITVPAYFNEDQRFATMKAGELAGWEVVRILNEPTAAAIAHGFHRRTTEGVLLVFDLGGGTFDVCVMDRFEGSLEVRSVAGESMLGGEDFTRRLAAVALARQGVQFERAEVVDPAATAILLRRAEALKCALSERPSAEIRVPPISGALREEVTETVTLEEAEEVFQPLIERLMGPCRAALRGASLNRTDVEDVILVGGATRMPCIRKFVEDLFQRPPLDGIDPDLAVVRGAAVQAALLEGDGAVGDYVVTDVASHSLGIEVSKQMGSRKMDGFFLPILHRNSVIPTSRVETVGTLEAGQTRLDLRVYEGESRRVGENRLIGTMMVTGIPKGAPGKAIDVRFTYDLNGILEVEATIVETGKVSRKVFHRESATLSEKELRAAAARLERLKRDPRERPKLRDIIARAHVVLQDLPPEQRQMVEDVLDALEAAIEMRDEQTMDALSRDLRRLCDRLGGEAAW